MYELSRFSRGLGGLAFFPLVVACVVFGMGIKAGFPKRGDGPETGVILIIAGLAIYALGWRLNRGVKSFRETRHSLCMIPLEVYGLVLSAAGLFLAVGTLMAPV